MGLAPLMGVRPAGSDDTPNRKEDSKMRGIVASILTALLVVGISTWSAAQSIVPVNQGIATTGVDHSTGMKTVRGSIQSVHPTEKTLTLKDGTTLTIPPSIANGPGIARTGAMVIATYYEEGNRKIVTSIQIESPPARA